VIVINCGGKRHESVEDLDVFKLAHQLALKIYLVSKTFPKEEMFSLVYQLHRAAGVNGLNGAKRLNGWNDWNGSPPPTRER
jgi:hypothetical protein